MANYAIMRCAKLKTMGGVSGSLQHNFRERETLNADEARTPENEHLAASSTSEAMGLLREKLPEKRRKDAVVCVEYLFTTSPEWAKAASEAAQARFFENSMKWLEKKYGAANVITATIQRDETTPHLSAFVVPITRDNRLSAKEFIGNKAKMSADQDTFAAAVKEVGLERGIKGSKAKHQSIRQYYSRVNSSERGQIKQEHVTQMAVDLKPKVLKKSWFGNTEENPDITARRFISKHFEPLVRTLRSTREELDSEKLRNEMLNKQAAKVPSNLRPQEVEQVLSLASKQKRDHQKAQRQKTREQDRDRGKDISR